MLELLTMACALGSAVIGGLLFAFSTSVMKALGKLPAQHGIAAMQSINIVIINPLFLLAFMGTAVACAVVAVLSLMRWDDPASAYRLAASVLYIVGTFGVTMVCNVPLNNALAAAHPDTQDAVRLWPRYLSEWTRWNHLRTAAAVAAAVLFIMALRSAR
jgi:uncharacterized membrane protein